jgi:hypothetical protein
MNLSIDFEFQTLIPPLTAEERTQLEANLGPRDGRKNFFWPLSILPHHDFRG